MAMSRSFGGRSFTTRSPMRSSPLVMLLEPGDHAQRRRLAAAGGADEHEELAVGDVEVEVRMPWAPFGYTLLTSSSVTCRPWPSYPFTDPASRPRTK